MVQDYPFRIGNNLTDSISNIVSQINKFETDTVKNKHITIDSIEVNYTKSLSKVITTNLFKNNNSKLLINCYFKDTALIKIDVTEISRTLANYCMISQFYFDSGKMIYQFTGGTIEMINIIPWDKNKSNAEKQTNLNLIQGYNPYLSVGFKLQYAQQLFKMLK